MSKLRFLFFLGIILLLAHGSVFGQKPKDSRAVESENQKILKRERQNKRLLAKTDTIGTTPKEMAAVDSIQTDDTAGFDAEVEYTADGYITLVQNSSGNKIFMYKNAQVKYKDIELIYKAELKSDGKLYWENSTTELGC